MQLPEIVANNKTTVDHAQNFAVKVQQQIQ
jgi:hypothetical protein